MYAKPPLTEAIIAIHVEARPTEKEMGAFSRRAKAEFPRVEDLSEITSELNLVENKTSFDMKKIGIKLTSNDQAWIVTLNNTQLAVSRLAPYTGWEALLEKSKYLYKFAKRDFSRVVVKKLSTRFLNRIDIPVDKDSSVQIGEWFKFGVTVPDGFNPFIMNSFSVKSTFFNPESKLEQIVQISSVPAPIIAHASFVLDIDVLTSEELPQREEQMWEMLNSLRAHKNRLFEASITAKTRELFDDAIASKK